MTYHDAPYAVRLKDYRPPPYQAQRIELTIELDPENTIVTSKVHYLHRAGEAQSLRLAGQELSLLSVHIDGKPLDLKRLDWSSEHLQLDQLPTGAPVLIEIKTSTRPKQNQALEGIYLSQGKFYSQCEPEGFRRLTYYLDRPDVMAVFQTTLVADKSAYPVLLSNGNLIEQGIKPDGKHFAVWHDPFPKPSYLFAVVAGDLSCVKDKFTTRSGRVVALHIYVERENLAKCSFAMEAIKRAMRWDEEVYQLEYDLDLFMVVAVSDFNMGAMENKGLNIFNAKYVLASPETATDGDFENILAVVGHEYFHNWTGNRITLRDWFQLSLKEGLTVFRDQQFSSDQGSHAVKRIQDVRLLRERQFPEDKGPMAHAVRPESYIEINNFYTATVYNKGAEIIRMLYSMLGLETYHRAMQVYFKKFDGQAITIEDFLDVVSQTSGLQLEQFKLWYQQPGTPQVTVESHYDAKLQQVTLRLTQSQGPKEAKFKALQIPVRLAFLARDGRPLESRYGSKSAHEHMVLLNKSHEEFVFGDVKEEVIPSVFRHFSAPVIVDIKLSRTELMTMLAHDTDAFNQYEASQTLFQQLIDARCKAAAETLDPDFIAAAQQLLRQKNADPRLVAMNLTPPSLDVLVHRLGHYSLETIFEARSWLLKQLATHIQSDLLESYERYKVIPANEAPRLAIGKRELKNICLALLVQVQSADYIELARQQCLAAKNMSDAVAALTALASLETPARATCLDAFYQQWKHDPLVMDKWFAIQASSTHPNVLQQVKQLLKHQDFDLLNPNRVYSVFGQFARSVPHGFHHPSGEGYSIISEYALRIDKKNPQVAAVLTNCLSRFRSFEAARQARMRQELVKMSEHKGLSRDVFEVVSKSLQD